MSDRELFIRTPLFVVAVTAALMTTFISSAGIAKPVDLKNLSSIEAKSIKRPTGTRTKYLKTRFYRMKKGQYRFRSSLARRAKDRKKSISKFKAKLKKNNPGRNKNDVSFPKWMLLPGQFAKSGNDQMKRKYGLDINLREGLPVLERSVSF